MSDRTKRLVLVFLLIPLWIALRYIYRDRIGAFGCFDDCFNFMGGYFLLSGKRLFSEIFFNHMPLMAHISAAIQYLTKPESIYMLVYEHRMALIYFFMIADALLVLRFGLAGFGFALLYESTKGFLFGERFLAEGIIVYPLVYLFGLAWGRKTIGKIEILFIVFYTWFVIFMREPYIPLVFWLFGTIIWFNRKFLWVAFVLFFASLATVFYYDAQDFFFNVITVNRMTATKEFSLASIFLYPLQLFGGGTWNMFRQIEVSLIIFLLAMRKNILFIFIVLLLANIRSVEPGAVYYGAFHHIVWYALLIFAVATRALQGVPLQRIIFVGIVLFAFFSPQSYLHEKVDRQTEFTTNYAQYYSVGETVRLLSNPSDTIFLDEWDDLIYWQAKRLSSYPYAWYTSSMPQFEIYQSARENMFATNPPDFYSGKCTDVVVAPSGYVRLLQNGKPSCLFVRNDKLPTITKEQWDSAKQFNYSVN